MQEELDKKRKDNEEARLKIQEQIEKLQKDYNDALNQTKNIQSKIEQTQKDLNKLNIEYAKKLDQINSKFYEAI
jgi:peptidoglycan hydrolase CwlO-like protein